MTPPGSIPPRGARIFLLRHGETTRPDLFHGAESDVPLGSAGHAQAAASATRLRPHDPVAIYSSTMARARQTAEILARILGLGEPFVVANLHERRMAALSGLPRDEAWPRYELTKDRWIAGEVDATHEGGESYRMIAARSIPAFLGVVRRHVAQSAVVVAHGVVIRVLLTSLLDGASPADWDRFGIDCGAINALDYDGARWTAWYLNGRPTQRER